MWLARNAPEKALTSIKEALDLASKVSVQRTLPMMQDYMTVLLRLQKYADLKRECDGVLKVPGVSETGWWVYQKRAEALANAGSRVEALNDYDRALEITGKLRNDDGVAVLIQSINDNIGADEALNRAERKANAGDNHWRVILAYLYLSKSRVEDASRVVEQVMSEVDKLTPGEKAAAYGVAGSLYMLSTQYGKALDVYEKLLALDAEDTVALNNLACLWTEYLEKKDPAKAVSYSSRALEVMQKRTVPDPNVYDTHGWALINAGQVDSGIEFIQTAIDRRPQMMEAHYHLGVGLLRKQLTLEAVRELEKAKKMLDDRKNQGQPTDLTVETKLNEALVKARLQLNGVSAGTGDAVKP
jgi:tetratricopeptide (TPR) repeat protein